MTFSTDKLTKRYCI